MTMDKDSHLYSLYIFPLFTGMRTNVKIIVIHGRSSTIKVHPFASWISPLLLLVQIWAATKKKKPVSDFMLFSRLAGIFSILTSSSRSDNVNFFDFWEPCALE